MKKLFLIWFFGLILTNVCCATDVGLAWYDNGSTISGPSSCTVGGTFTPPTPPARPGYRFTGWKAYVRCGIPDLDTSTIGIAFGHARLNGDAGSNESIYGLTTPGQWATQFSYGVVYGMANCNSTSGTSNVAATITTASSGRYCWCQATGFTPTSSSYTSGPQCTVSPASSSWVFRENYGTPATCARFCTNSCGGYVRDYAASRSAVFGAVGQ